MPREYVAYTSDDDLWPYANSIRPDGYTYLISWGMGGDAIVKIGSTSAPRRWRGYLTHGGRVELIIRSTHEVRLETEIDDALRAIAPPAFSSKQQAEPYLGSRGAGWMECYRVRPEVALKVAKEVLSSG